MFAIFNEPTNHKRPKPDYVAPGCAGTERITDAMLFYNRLNLGERSAVFGSDSKILREYADADRACFFYLHVAEEVARIESPTQKLCASGSSRSARGLARQTVELGLHEYALLWR